MTWLIVVVIPMVFAALLVRDVIGRAHKYRSSDHDSEDER